jgi:phospholipid N-methyltransferase
MIFPLESLVLTAGTLSYLFMSRQNTAQVELRPETLALFKNYANITDKKEIQRRIIRVQKIATNVHSYRCIERFHFIIPRSLLHPDYQRIISNIKEKTVLDMGCCMGADTRQMIIDGVIKENICGIDLEKTFIELGYELFNDREAMHDKFFAMNIFDKKTWPETFSSQLFDVIYCGSVLHLLNYEDGIKLIQFTHDFLTKDGIFFGRTVGSSMETPINRSDKKDALRYMHSSLSLKELLTKHGFKNIKITVDVSEMLNQRQVERRDEFNGFGLLSFYAEKA